VADLGIPLEAVPALNGGGGFDTGLLGGIAPPDIPVTIPPSIDLTPIAPIDVPPDPFPGAPTVELPPLPGEPVGAPGAPGAQPVVVLPPGVEPMPPGAPGSAENPIQVTTTLGPQPPPPFPPPPPGPVIEQPPPVTVTQTSAGGGAVAIATASINQNIQIMNQDVQPLADAVQKGIAQGAQDASQIAQQTTQQITDSLNQFSNGLFGWVQSLWQWIKDNIGPVLSAIANALKDAAKAIFDAITQALKDVGKFFTDTIGPILTKIGDAVANIANFYQQHIAPILNTIAAVERTVAAAIVAIEKDVNSGLQGILRLPGDLANALSNLGNELIRAGRALQVTRKSDANVYFYGDEPGSFAYHIKTLGDAVIGLAASKEKTTYAPGNETLSEPSLAQDLPKVLEAVNAITLDIAKGIANLVQDPKAVLEVLGIAGVGIWAGVFETIEILFALFEILKAPLEVVGELAAETTRAILPITKLDPATLTAAWRRNLISTDTMNQEMVVQGYNGERSELLRRLTTYVEDAQTLVDFYFRGVVDQSDFSSGLRDLGYTDAQITALQEGSTTLLDVADAVTALRRGEMDDKTFDEVLAVNRHPDAQRQLLRALAFAPPNYAAAFAADQVTRVASALNVSTPSFDSIPKPVVDAGRADGLDDAAILAQWTGAYNTLPASAWLSLYWRGQASLGELTEVLFRDKVPPELTANWIDSQRPLIPFRTVPALVTAGLMSQSDAIAYMQKHGYSLEDAVLLMKYATRQTKSTKAATATAQKGISEAQAKTAYVDGLIGRDQYLALLAAHGWDATAAQLEVQLTDIEQEQKDRKQIGTDIVNEFQAGMIDQQTALQQLAQSGYTPAEQAAVLRKLTSARSQKAKTPSEAELRAFTKADIITPDDYQQNLVVLGYSSAWAAAFRALHFPIAAAPAGA
jgi:hypothetical protein